MHRLQYLLELECMLLCLDGKKRIKAAVAVVDNCSMLEDLEVQRNSSKKSDLNSYFARRTLLATMVAHLAVFLLSCYMAYATMPGSSELLECLLHSYIVQQPYYSIVCSCLSDCN